VLRRRWMGAGLPVAEEAKLAGRRCGRNLRSGGNRGAAAVAAAMPEALELDASEGARDHATGHRAILCSFFCG